MHNKGDEHRIYLRSGAQKVEADYLQLNALFEKRSRTSLPITVSISDLHQRLALKKPGDKNQTSEHWYRFVIAPETHGAARRLTAQVEEEFDDSLVRFFTGGFGGQPAARDQHTTVYRHHKDAGHEQVFALTSDGAIGYATQACTNTNDGLFFSPWEFCNDVIKFLGLAARFATQSRYFGEYRLTANILIPEANIIRPGTFEGRLVTGQLFDPTPTTIVINTGSETRVTLHPNTGERMQRALANIAYDIARAGGMVLSPTFDQFAVPFIQIALQTLAHP
jgi:hypothetical protein